MSELVISTGANARLVNTAPDGFFDDDLRVGRTGGGTVQRTLVRFVFSTLPTGAIVTAATLRLWLTAGLSTQPVHGLHRVMAPWMAGQATWNSRATGVAWSTPGGDFLAAPSDAIAVPASVPPGGAYLAWDVAALMADVRAAQGSDLDCLILAADEPNQTERAIYQAFGGVNPPTLTLIYTVPEPEPEVSVGEGRYQPDRGQKRPKTGEREPLWVQRGFSKFARPRK
jgi:hypothetical protein